jgi:hypothetical protein
MPDDELGANRGATPDGQMSVLGALVAIGVFLLLAPLVPVAVVLYAVWRLVS